MLLKDTLLDDLWDGFFRIIYVVLSYVFINHKSLWQTINRFSCDEVIIAGCLVLQNL